MRIIKICLIACLVFSFSIKIYAGEHGDRNKQLIKERKRLGNIEKRIKKEIKEIKKAAGKERELLQELAEIDAVLAKQRDAAGKAEKKLIELKKTISLIKNRIKRLQKEKRKRKQGLKKRLTALYKLGNIGPVNLLFSSTSHFELEKRYVFIKLVIERDALAIEEYLSGIDDLNDSYKAIDAKRSEARTVHLKLAAQKVKTQRQLNKKKKLIASIARSKTLHEKKLAELKTSSLRLEKLLVRLEDSLNSSDYVPYGGGSFSALKGHLGMPFNAEVTAFFGKSKDIDFNTYIVRKGIDIAAPWGSEVVAIYDGKVIYADNFKGYGNIVIIDHGEGYYTLSANLSKILKGKDEELSAGSLIALSGDTGSLVGPRLYFEIRYKGKPVDPLDWLKLPPKNIAKKRSSGRNR